MKKSRLLGAVCTCLLLHLGVSNTAAALMLDFSGVTDDALGYQIGGVPATIGTPFTVWISIDDTNAASGIYPILDVQGSLGGTLFTTSGPWDIEPLHAVQETGGILLSHYTDSDSPNVLNSSGEMFFLDVRILGSGVIATDPTTWFGTGPLGNGVNSSLESPLPDIYVQSSISNVDISTNQPFPGPLLLGSTVPIPGAIWLFGSGLLGLVGMARRKKAA